MATYEAILSTDYFYYSKNKIIIIIFINSCACDESNLITGLWGPEGSGR
jgi:hypothetical protein